MNTLHKMLRLTTLTTLQGEVSTTAATYNILYGAKGANFGQEEYLISVNGPDIWRITTCSPSLPPAPVRGRSRGSGLNPVVDL